MLLAGIASLLAAWAWGTLGASLNDGSIFQFPPAIIFFGIPCVFFGVFGLLFIYWGCKDMSYASNESNRKEANEKLPPENVTASELIANKIRAENRYKDRHLNVTGTITNIAKNIVDAGATVRLNAKPSENEKGVGCNFVWDRYVEKLSIGQTVTIAGIYRYDNYMENCSVYDLNPSQQSYPSNPHPEPAKSSNPVFDSMLRKATAGDPKAQYDLSQAYFDGEIVQRNDNKGLEWLMKSANKDYPDALFELGGMYLNGFLVERNYEKGQYYMKRAAELGHEQAKFIVSMTQSLTIPKPSMPDEEYDSIRKKAESGDREAQYKLGMFYFEELHDNQEAVRWFFKSANQGYSEAAVKMEIIIKADPGLWSWLMNNPDARI